MHDDLGNVWVQSIFRVGDVDLEMFATWLWRLALAWLGIQIAFGAISTGSALVIALDYSQAPHSVQWGAIGIASSFIFEVLAAAAKLAVIRYLIELGLVVASLNADGGD